MPNTNFSTTTNAQTVTLASGVETVIASFTDLSLAKGIYLALKVTAGDNLHALKMQVRLSSDFAWQDYLDTNDWQLTNNTTKRLWTSDSDPATLDVGEGSELQVQCLGFVEAQFLATNDGAGTTTLVVAARITQK